MYTLFMAGAAGAVFSQTGPQAWAREVVALLENGKVTFYRYSFLREENTVMLSNCEVIVSFKCNLKAVKSVVGCQQPKYYLLI